MKNVLTSSLENGASFITKNKNFFKNISRAPLYNDEPQFYHYSTTFQLSSNKEETTSTGFAFDKKRALMKVFGETIERIALETYSDDLPFYSYPSTKLAINPILFSPFSDKQLKNKAYFNSRINGLEKFHWVEGYSCKSREKVLIPAQLVYVPFGVSEKEPYIREQISTGAACGSSLKDAIYRGLCETIERDSFMIGYLNKLPFPRIDIENIRNKKIQEIIKQLKRYNLEYFVIDTTTDIGIPSFAALVIDRTGKGPSVSVGLKAGFDMFKAIIGALEESLMTRAWLRDEIYYKRNTKKGSPKHMIEIEERASYWFPLAVIKYFDFWTKSSLHKLNRKTKQFNNFYEEATKAVLKHSEVYYVDITPAEAKKLGFYVVKVLAPSLYPLYLDESLRYLGVKRLYAVPVSLGYMRKPLSENQLNSVPHPIL